MLTGKHSKSPYLAQCQVTFQGNSSAFLSKFNKVEKQITFLLAENVSSRILQRTILSVHLFIFYNLFFAKYPLYL